MTNRYKDRTKQTIYDACLRLAADNFSELYIVTSRFGGVGPHAPRGGANIRTWFWRGYKGVGGTEPSWPVHAAFMAGREFAKGKRA